MVNATFASVFAHQCEYNSKYGIYHVCSRVNICLHYICAVQIWCKSIFSCSERSCVDAANEFIGLISLINSYLAFAFFHFSMTTFLQLGVSLNITDF